MMIGTAGRNRFELSGDQSRFRPSSFRSRTTASTCSWLKPKTPSCPLPELSTSQPCSLSSAQRRFKSTGSFPMQRTEFRLSLDHRRPPLPGPSKCKCPAPVHMAIRVQYQTESAHSAVISNHTYRRALQPVRRSSGSGAIQQPRAFLVAICCWKMRVPRARISAHARAPQRRRVFPQRLPSV